jgi:hypothetical protein
MMALSAEGLFFSVSFFLAAAGQAKCQMLKAKSAFLF